MLFWKDLRNTINFISKSSKAKTRVVTNAFWARKLNRARKILKEAKEIGLSEINYSVDDFHQEHIPLESIRHAVIASEENNIPLVLAHKTYPNSRSSLSTYEALLDRKIPKLENLSFEQLKHTSICMSSGYTIPIGKGSEKVEPENWLPINYSDDMWTGPCLEVMNAINISSRGILMPCCGLVDRSLGVFYAGDIREEDLFTVVERASSLVLYNWLALKGPSNIMELVKQVDRSIPFLKKYVQKCHLCQNLFSNPRVIEILAENLDYIGKKLVITRSLFETQRLLASRV